MINTDYSHLPEKLDLINQVNQVANSIGKSKVKKSGHQYEVLNYQGKLIPAHKLGKTIKEKNTLQIIHNIFLNTLSDAHLTQKEYITLSRSFESIVTQYKNTHTGLWPTIKRIFDGQYKKEFISTNNLIKATNDLNSTLSSINRHFMPNIPTNPTTGHEYANALLANQSPGTWLIRKTESSQFKMRYVISYVTKYKRVHHVTLRKTEDLELLKKKHGLNDDNSLKIKSAMYKVIGHTNLTIQELQFLSKISNITWNKYLAWLNKDDDLLTLPNLEISAPFPLIAEFLSYFKDPKTQTIDPSATRQLSQILAKIHTSNQAERATILPELFGEEMNQLD